MKILLDEQLHVNLKPSLSTFNVFEPKDFNWDGLKNGELREKMNENGFTFFVTSDKNLPFQQNLNKTNFTIILLDTPTLKWVHISLFVGKIREILSNPPLILPKLIHISIVEFHNEKRIANLQNLLPPDQILFI
jgi:hypothetical protein